MTDWKLVYKTDILGTVVEYGDRKIPTEGLPVTVRYVKFIRESDQRLQEWEVGSWLVDFVNHWLIIASAVDTQSNVNNLIAEKVIGDR